MTEHDSEKNVFRSFLSKLSDVLEGVSEHALLQGD